MNLRSCLSRVNSQEWDCWVIWRVSVELCKKMPAVFQTALPLKANFKPFSSIALPSPVSHLSRPQSGFKYQAKLPFRRCNVLESYKRQRHTISVWPPGSNMAWAGSLTGWGSEKREGVWGNSICGQLGTWRCNLDPKPEKTWWFGLSLKHQAKDEMLFQSNRSLLRGERSMELFVLKPDPPP